MSISRQVRRFYTPGWQIWRATTATNEYNEQIKTFALSSTVDGAMRQLRGGEEFIGAGHAYTATHRFYCDATTDIREGDQVRKGGNAYAVHAANDVMQQGQLLQVDVEWQQ